jgi:hypothetical protein
MFSDIFSHQHFSDVLPIFFVNIFCKCCQHFFSTLFGSLPIFFLINIFSSTFFRSVANIFRSVAYIFSRQHFLGATFL